MILKYKQKPHITYYDDRVTIESESWFYNGGLHREDGPACIQYREDGTIWREAWHQHGNMHRLDGPALSFGTNYITFNETITWWVRGKQYEFSEWLNYCSWDDATKVEMKLIYG